MRILVLNAGSSSLKASVREVEGEPSAPLWSAHAEWGRQSGAAEVRIEDSVRSIPIQCPADVLRPVIEAAPRPIDAIGHRVVHGGQVLQQTSRVTPEVKAEIRKYAEFAPEHNRLELDAMDVVQQMLGASTPQVAVFDTAFHAGMPEAARVYAGPYEWYEGGIRRYGFHGISHQYVSRHATEVLGRPAAGLRLITCHLGNGASLAAVRDGRSIDTTMGFTPLDGLVMGTRPGSLDPGIPIYLVRHKGMDAAQLDRLLNHDSGLKGVSGVSGDMREILAAIARGNVRARLAFDVYIHRLCREMGAMAASLGGVDALVFTAGVGENCPEVRQRACEQLAFLGIELDAQKNAHAAADSDVATAGSRVRVLVMRTDEESEIAREAGRLLRSGR